MCVWGEKILPISLPIPHKNTQQKHCQKQNPFQNSKTNLILKTKNVFQKTFCTFVF